MADAPTFAHGDLEGSCIALSRHPDLSERYVCHPHVIMLHICKVVAVKVRIGMTPRIDGAMVHSTTIDPHLLCTVPYRDGFGLAHGLGLQPAAGAAL
jgi:hypothetical protein